MRNSVFVALFGMLICGHALPMPPFGLGQFGLIDQLAFVQAATGVQIPTYVPQDGNGGIVTSAGSGGGFFYGTGAGTNYVTGVNGANFFIPAGGTGAVQGATVFGGGAPGHSFAIFTTQQNGGPPQTTIYVPGKDGNMVPQKI